MTPKQLAKKHGKYRANESMVDAMKRSLAFAQAMIDEGHDEVLASGMAASKLHAADRIANVHKAIANARAAVKVSGKGRNGIVAAERRFGAKLPASVKALWELLASPPHRTWLRGFCVRSFLEPALLIPPPKWAKDAKLTTAWSLDRKSISDTRERLEKYTHRFDEADAKLKMTESAQLARTKPPKGFLLDPALRQDLITIAQYDHEHWFVVTGLASKKHPAPVFSNHDDAEGESDFHASDVAGWLSQEISESMIEAAHWEG